MSLRDQNWETETERLRDYDTGDRDVRQRDCSWETVRPREYETVKLETKTAKLRLRDHEISRQRLKHSVLLRDRYICWQTERLRLRDCGCKTWDCEDEKSGTAIL